jgi:hypothetical protein
MQRKRTVSQSSDNDQNIDNIVMQATMEMQRRMEIDVALFASSTGIKSATNNLYFRQLLKNFRNEFQLPQLEKFNVDECLEKAAKNTNEIIKKIVANKKITLLVNLIYVFSFECYVISISASFEYNQKVEIALLNICDFDPLSDESFDLTPMINKVIYYTHFINKTLSRRLKSTASITPMLWEL